MPLGIARLNTLSRYIVAAAPPAAQRTALTVTGYGDAKLDTTRGKFGSSSIRLDGTGDFLNAVNSGGTDIDFGTGDFTVEGFVYFNTLPSGDEALVTGPAQTGSLYIQFYNSLIRVGRTNTAWDATSSSVSLSTGVWYHWAVSRTSGTMEIYFNGSRIYNAANTNSYKFANGAIRIGSYLTSNPPTANAFYFIDGWMDELRISSTSRYSGSSLTVPTSAFVNDSDTELLLHADGSNGDVAFLDDNGVRAPVALASISDAVTTNTQYKFGSNSMRFDGNNNTDQRLYAYNAAQGVGTSDFTLECWARFDDFNALHAVTYIGGQAFYIGSDGKIAYYFGSGTSGTTVMSTNTWYHLAWSRQGTNLRMFVNGNLEVTRTDSTSLNLDLLIGCKNANDQDMRGYIDEYRFSDTARYTASFTAPTTAFTNDADTKLLLHFEPVADSKTVFDDNEQTIPSFPLPTVLYSGLTRPLSTTTGSGWGYSSSVKKFGTYSGDNLPRSSNGYMYATIDNSKFDPADRSQTWTYEMWLNPSSGNRHHGGFGNSAGSGLGGLSIYTYATDTLLVYSGASGGGWRWGNNYGAGITNGNGNWTHIAVCAESDIWYVYVNGNYIGQEDMSAKGNMNVSDWITVGFLRNGTSFETGEGYYDEVRVSNVRRYTGTSTYTIPSSAFTNDANTIFLAHFENNANDDAS